MYPEGYYPPPHTQPDKQKFIAPPEFLDKPFTVNGIEFSPLPNQVYLFPYWKIPPIQELKEFSKEFFVYRNLALHDPFFFIYFILHWKKANHPFIIDWCNELATTLPTDSIDLRPREHGKSTIQTVTRSIQSVLRSYVLYERDETIGLVSWSRTNALKFLRQIKDILEGNEFLQKCFMDALYKDPTREASLWSVSDGITIRRRNPGALKEATFEALGLNESLPAGPHYIGLMYDDIETQELMNSPDVAMKVKTNFDLSEYLGSDEPFAWTNVVGTFYLHDGPLMHAINKVDEKGQRLFNVRIKPGTDNGRIDGKPLFFNEESRRWKRFKSNVYTFNTQILLDPTPPGSRKLDSKWLKFVKREDVPRGLYRFLLVDPAGVDLRKDRRGDCWAMLLIGVKPCLDDKGLSDLYVLRMFVDEAMMSEALDQIVRMYMQEPRVLKVAVEKIGQSSHELHVKNALAKHGVTLDVDNGTLHILTSKGRSKGYRIESNLQLPLINGKIHVVDDIDPAFIDRFKLELDKFPAWSRDDVLDALAYGYDVITEYSFPYMEEEEWNEEEASSSDEDEWGEDALDGYDREESLNELYTVNKFMGV